MSVGGSSNSSKSTGSQWSTNESQDFGSDVWGSQSPYLQDLYRRASGNIAPANKNMFNQQANMLTYAAGQNIGDARRTQQAAQMNLAGFSQPTVDPAFKAYATNLAQQMKEQFLPQLKGEAALAGGLGGSRQQIGSALGMQRAWQSLGDFAANTYAGQQERKLAAAQQMTQNAAGFAGIGEAQAGLADFARSMPWYALSQYQGLLGGPVQVDKGGYSKGQSQATSSTKGKGGGFNFGFGSG